MQDTNDHSDDSNKILCLPTKHELGLSSCTTSALSNHLQMSIKARPM
jgi:hypothetical protein